MADRAFGKRDFLKLAGGGLIASAWGQRALAQDGRVLGLDLPKQVVDLIPRKPLNYLRIADAVLQLEREAFLSLVRSRAGVADGAPGSFLRVRSFNRFPTASGLASSASGYAALAAAASAAYGLRLDDVALSALARRGSASAARSVGETICRGCCVPTSCSPRRACAFPSSIRCPAASA